MTILGDPTSRAGQTVPARPARVLAFSTVFPSPADPLHGLFVLERLRHLAGRTDLRVVAPVSWLAWRKLTARQEERDGLAVTHPTFFYLPGLLKPLDGLFLFLSSLLAARRLFREAPFDLIDAHFAYPDGFAAVLLGRWFHRPVTITLRGTLIALQAYPLRHWLAGWALRHADRVIAVSQPLARHALTLGVPEEAIQVIGNGIDPGRFAMLDRAEARRRLGLPAQGRVVVSVGHLCRRKGFDRLIALLPQVRQAVGAVTLAIVGGPGKEGDEGPALARQVAAAGLGEAVRLVGRQPPEQVMLWLNAADLFVLASSMEGSPNVVCEALACGCPVVASDVGDLRHLIDDSLGSVSGPAEDSAAMTAAIIAALSRDWDRAAIRRRAEARPWSLVADEVLAQWSRACQR